MIGCRLLSFAILAIALPAAAQLPFPDRLTVVETSTRVEISSISGPLAGDIDPAFAQAAAGDSFVSADHTSGQLKGRATIADAFADTLFTSAAYEVTLGNSSGRAAPVVARGVPKLDVGASFARTAGLGLGLLGHTLSATFAIVIADSLGNVSYQGAGSFAFTATLDPGETELRIALTPTELGGFDVRIDDYDARELHVSIVAPDLLLAPGLTLRLAASVSGTATAFSFDGSSGFSARTDFGDTAQLSMALPAGFGLESELPVDWITLTPVPEPSAALLLGFGLLAVAATKRRLRDDHPAPR